jgi:hypothetical protein
VGRQRRPSRTRLPTRTEPLIDLLRRFTTLLEVNRDNYELEELYLVGPAKITKLPLNPESFELRRMTSLGDDDGKPWFGPPGKKGPEPVQLSAEEQVYWRPTHSDGLSFMVLLVQPHTKELGHPQVTTRCGKQALACCCLPTTVNVAKVTWRWSTSAEAKQYRSSFSLHAVEKTPAWIQDHIDGTPAEAPASPIALDGTVTPPPVESDGVAPDDGGTLTPSSKTPWVTLGVSKRKYQDMMRHFSPASPRPSGLIPLPSSPGADSSAPVLSPNEEKRALCTTLLTQYGKNKSVAVGWSVLEVTDTPDLFDAWHSVVGPLLDKLEPLGWEGLSKLYPVGTVMNKPWPLVAGRSAHYSNALHSLAGMTTLPTEMVGLGPFP